MRKIRLLECALFMLLFMGHSAAYAFSDKVYDCQADATWFSSPTIPKEVAKSAPDGTSNFCDFYQFSWQAFAYLMSPVDGKAIRNFENTEKYYELEVKPDGTPENSCDNVKKGNTLFVRIRKSTDAGGLFAIPERIGQAGGGATIYDQQQNVVYYDVRFSQNMCNVETIKSLDNFPSGTTELKTAWKVLTKKDNTSQYITMDTVIGKQKTPTKLGMIGFHIAIATKDHPEFVWATFEHNVNAPDCVAPQALTGWSFASEMCTIDLAESNVLGVIQCRFNHPFPQKNPEHITGSPTEICREYPYGSAPDDPHYDENIDDIITLNANVQPFLTGSYAVLKNYFNLGAIWLSDIKKDSDLSNQRGSLRLANSVAETDFQNVDLSSSFISNCFGCHNYTGTDNVQSSKNTTSGNLSHIFDDITVGSGQCLDVQANRTINSQPEAKATCPTTCSNSSSLLKWNGQWTNQNAQSGAQLPMSVCGCCGK